MNVVTFYTTNALQLISTKYLDTNSALDFNRIIMLTYFMSKFLCDRNKDI